MRLIATISKSESELNPYEFCYYLTSQGIRNECEEIATDLGGIHSYRIWVYEEDDVEKASSLFNEYRKNPKDGKFRAHYEQAIRIHQEKINPHPKESLDEKEVEKRRVRFLSPAPYGRLSLIILFAVVALFIWSQLGRQQLIPPAISGIIQAPILAPIEKKLIYDYPHYFVLRDRLFSVYTPEEIKEKKPASNEAVSLIKEIRKTPVWMGIYERIIAHFKDSKSPILYHGPIFEKIGGGQIWRLITPAFLHFGLLHIFFNVLWFILLGNQIEYRIGMWRYLMLIIATAIASNTAQYLMSGPFFMGLSGIVVGMAGFIFARQQIAPWEGYLLHRFTLIFLAIFVLGMFILQLVLFFIQMFGKFELNFGIANTAHLIGGAVGYLLGRMRFFSLKRHPHNYN